MLPQTVSATKLADVCARRVSLGASSYFVADVLHFIANAVSQFRTARRRQQHSRRDPDPDTGGETRDISKSLPFARIDRAPRVLGELRGSIRDTIHSIGCLVHDVNN